MRIWFAAALSVASSAFESISRAISPQWWGLSMSRWGKFRTKSGSSGARSQSIRWSTTKLLVLNGST
jgi:hypothetical protein